MSCLRLRHYRYHLPLRKIGEPLAVLSCLPNRAELIATSGVSRNPGMSVSRPLFDDELALRDVREHFRGCEVGAELKLDNGGTTKLSPRAPGTTLRSKETGIDAEQPSGFDTYCEAGGGGINEAEREKLESQQPSRGEENAWEEVNADGVYVVCLALPAEGNAGRGYISPSPKLYRWDSTPAPVDIVTPAVRNFVQNVPSVGLKTEAGVIRLKTTQSATLALNRHFYFRGVRVFFACGMMFLHS